MPSISVSLDAEIISYFEKLAYDKHSNRSAEINQALKEYISEVPEYGGNGSD